MTTKDVQALFDKFLSDNNGKYIDVLPDHAKQCFDLAVCWTNLLGVPHFAGNPSPFPYANAFQIFTQPNSVSSQYFDFIANSPTGVPQKGDIVVWNGTLNGGIGHVAVATGNGDTTKFESFDQNWVPGSVSKLIQHSYNYVLGWLRLKVTQDTMNPTIQSKASKFDRWWDAYYPGANTDLVTDSQAANRVQWSLQERDRAVEFDRVVQALFPGQDSNRITSAQVLAKLNGFTQADLDKAKEAGRQQGIKQCQDTLAKL